MRMRKTTLLLLPVSMVLFWVCAENVFNLSQSNTPREMFDMGRNYFYQEDYGSSQIVFEQLTRLNVVAEYSDSARYLLGEAHYFQKNYILAQSEYDRMISNFPSSDLVIDAKYKSALCFYELSPSQKYDQDYTLKAIAAFEAFLTDPRSQTDEEIFNQTNDRLFELHQKLAEKDLKSAQLYRRMREYNSAIYYLDDAMADYNTYGHVTIIPDALFEKAECFIGLEKFSDAREALQALIDNFPGHSLIAKAREKLTLIKTESAEADTTMLN